jgi:CRISPR-associated protein (TIGR03986 family)
MITAPFNFVPLNEKVFFPPWTEKVSHDVPFEDGESGVIDITVTAENPIFIRDHINPEEFCSHNSEYYIPSSSIKGMIRNVLEIMSFSKMSFIDDTTYSVRDLKYNKYMEKAKNVQCGWLYYDNDGKLKIEDCGEPYKIRYEEIEKKFGGKFKKQKFMNGTFDNAKSPYKKAYEKYNLIDDDIFNNTFTFTSDESGKKIVKFEKNSLNIGKLVLTGHPSSRREPEEGKASGKIYDFVFMQKENPTILDVDKKVFDNFKFAYFNERKTQPKESEDWAFWKHRLNNSNKIPVFFHKNTSGVSSFGLSYLYKFPYTKSMMKALIGNHKSNEIDLAKSIFGFSKKEDDKQLSLKGRVQFSHAKKICNTNPLQPRYVLLGTPKASYYPIYLIQNGNEYKTLMDGNSILAGWKRYPIHKNFNHNCQGKSTQTTCITPLNKGAKFKLKVRFHNLKKVEIGALLSALTFHNNSSSYFHSLGLAKSYGYGKVSLNITRISNLKFSQNEYLKAFESAMNSEVFDSKIVWHESEQIKNLFSMAKPQDDTNLQYMKLSEFAKEKNNYNYLDRYINLEGVSSCQPKELSNSSSIQEYQNDTKEIKEVYLQRKNEREKAKRLKEEEEKEREREKNNWQKAKASNTIESLDYFIKTYANSFYLNEAQKLIENIKQKEFEKKKQQAQQESNIKWEAIQKVEKKFKQKAFEDFIKNYPESTYKKEAEATLQSIKKRVATPTSKNSLSLLTEKKDFKGFKNIIIEYKKANELNEEDKKTIKEALINFYQTTSKKNKKKFLKEFKLSALVDSLFEEIIKKELNL